jgi:hypothetical protein
MTQQPEIVGRIGRDKRRSERLAFILPDGRVSSYFDRDVDLDRVRVLAVEIGLRVLDDDETVVRG